MNSLANFYHPAYAIGILAFVSLLAWPASYASPFFRAALAVEDQTRLTPLDGLRGILCFAVLICHAAVTHHYLEVGEWIVPSNHLYTLLGQTPVALFFCVTGFLFWGRVVAQDGEIKAKSFLVARVFRIVPLYVFSCLVAVAVLSPHIHWLSSTAIRGLAPIGTIGLCPWFGFGTPGASSINAGAPWTLQYEWGFYLMLPMLARAFKGASSRLWLFAAGLLLIFGVGPAACFMPGVLAVYAARDQRLVAWLRHPATTVILLLAVSTMPVLPAENYGRRALLLTTIIFVPIACGNSVFGLLNLRGLRLMGIISYSVYLLHGVCLYVLRPTLLVAKEHQPVWVFWAETAACAGGVLLISMLTYRWIEWPFIAAEKHLRRTSWTVTLPRWVPATREPVPMADNLPA